MTFYRKRNDQNRDSQERARQSLYGNIERPAHAQSRSGKKVVVTVPGAPVEVRDVWDDVLPNRMSKVPLREDVPAERMFRK